MSLKISVAALNAQKALSRLQRKIPAELAKAINKTATKSRSSIVNELSAVSGAKKKNIRRLLPIKRADGRDPKKLFAIIKIIGKRLPLLALTSEARAAGDGLQAKVAKKRIFIKKGFVAKMPGGHRGIFRRVGEKRLPIIEEKVPANPEIFESKGLGKIEFKKNEKLLEALFLENLRKLTKDFNR